ncbi:AraC family transcriptional regulator [Aliagarivorans marinus]|uniref:AraC family transcriptional regulator n=1 Tax=Aliagarivorans marinus TaxID=561965 RepID=UPI0003FD1830|nr:AraC family transcriptional regulator [Aliagarivorans marinus]
MESITSHNQLINQMLQLLPEQGVVASHCRDVDLVRSDFPTERVALVYQPVLYIVIQGTKHSYLGDERYRYDPLNFLALSVPLPMEGHVVEASPQSPYLALKVKLRPEWVGEMMVEPPKREHSASVERGVCVSPLNAEMQSGLARLVNALSDPLAAQTLAPLIIKELLYHALLGPQGAQLAAFVTSGRHHQRIARVIQFIQENYQQSLDVERLAEQANMSPSSLHQHFKSVTNASPLQYIKSLRLHHARELVTNQQRSVSEAAYQVGYQSLSQFSREYKRLFGESPSQDKLGV